MRRDKKKPERRWRQRRRREFKIEEEDVKKEKDTKKEKVKSQISDSKNPWNSKKQPKRLEKQIS